jgi:putative transposase
MTSWLKRYYGDDHPHFLTWTCYHRQGWLAEPKRRDLFLHILEEARRRYRFVVVGYVVMPEHVHLLISEPEQGPSTVMQVEQLSELRVRRRGHSEDQSVAGGR